MGFLRADTKPPPGEGGADNKITLYKTDFCQNEKLFDLRWKFLLQLVSMLLIKGRPYTGKLFPSEGICQVWENNACTLWRDFFLHILEPAKAPW